MIPPKVVGARFRLLLHQRRRTLSNLGWAEQGLADDFRFTIAVNIDRTGSIRLISEQDMSTLAAQGFEIANHTSTHCNGGMTRCTDEVSPPDCDPGFGDLRGYFDEGGTFASLEEAMPFFSHEIDRDHLAAQVTGLAPRTSAPSPIHVMVTAWPSRTR